MKSNRNTKVKRNKKPLIFQINILFHRYIFTEGTVGYMTFKNIYHIMEKWKSGATVLYFFERQIKRVLFDCQECGDCALFEVAYLCPMSKCAKFQRNGPCGGTKNGMCEADDTKRCVWSLVYERLSPGDDMYILLKDYVPPVDCSLSKTSSWANFFLGRDHISKKIAMSKGEK